MLRHAAAHGAFDLLHAVLDYRPAFGAGDFLPASPLHGAGAFLHDVAILRNAAFAVDGFAFFAVASPGHGFVARFAYGLVAGVPPFFLDGVIHELVADAILLLAR